MFPETHMGIRILKELILIPSIEDNANLQGLAPLMWLLATDEQRFVISISFLKSSFH